jgi:pimeloyl-ACP methyl ester carboxylesterase
LTRPVRFDPVRMELRGAEGDRLAADLFDGGGRTVVFLHGGGQTRRAWDATARRVADAGMRVVTVDLRGHGESDWSAAGHYGFAWYGADVDAMTRQLTARFGDRPTIVGASLGGLSALVAEVRHGPVAEALVLVDVTPRMNPDGVARIQGFMGARMKEGFATLDEAADAIAGYLPNRKRPRSLDGLRKNLRLDADGRYRWHWDPAFLVAMRDFDQARAVLMEVEAALPRLSLPVLLVRGMDSELVDADMAGDFIARLPNGRFVDVTGAGHMVAGDKNDAFSDAILDFLGERAAA